jgi:hypothetical protein
MEYKESKLSAHHNYILNLMLTPGFVLGDPYAANGFYFLADFVLPGESTPRISGRLMDEKGDLLVELKWNRICENPGGYLLHSLSGGFSISGSAGQTFLEVRTQSFANGYLTIIKARLFDENGIIRMEPLGESSKVYGIEKMVLESPFTSRTKT